MSWRNNLLACHSLHISRPSWATISLGMVDVFGCFFSLEVNEEYYKWWWNPETIVYLKSKIAIITASQVTLLTYVPYLSPSCNVAFNGGFIVGDQMIRKNTRTINKPTRSPHLSLLSVASSLFLPGRTRHSKSPQRPPLADATQPPQLIRSSFFFFFLGPLCENTRDRIMSRGNTAYLSRGID